MARPDRWRRSWGVDGTGAACRGRTLLTGWPDRDPVIPGAVPYGDVIVPYRHGRVCHRRARHIAAHRSRLSHRRLDVRDLRAADARGTTCRGGADGRANAAAMTDTCGVPAGRVSRPGAKIVGSRSAFDRPRAWTTFADVHGVRAHDATTRDAELREWCATRIDIAAASCRKRASPPAWCRTSGSDRARRPLSSARRTGGTRRIRCWAPSATCARPSTSRVMRPQPFRAPHG